MDKKTEMTESEIRRGLAARQPRINGRFASLPPEKKVGNVRASRAKASSAVASAPVASAPVAGGAPSEKEIAKQIGLLESLIKQRSAMGFESSELENYVVGMKGQKGVRSVVEDYIRSNRDKFNQEDPAGAAAYELMEEAVALSESALNASHDEAKRIYAKLNFIRELAKNTQGEQGDIANQLQEIISPVEKQLKKKSSFKAFLTEKASDFKKTIPEKIASKIPVVGGLLGEFLKKKRQDREEIEQYTGTLQKKIARKGRSGEGLNVSGKRGFGEIGGTSAADIPGMLAGTESPQSSPASPQTGTPSTLGELLKEVSQIRKLLQNKFVPESDTSDTAELQKRESELEGLGAEKPIKGEAKKGGGMLSSIKNMLGMGGGEGILSRIASGAGSVGTALLGAPSLAKKGLVGAGGLAMKGLRGAGGLISKFGGKQSLEFLKTTSLYKDTASIGKSVSGVAKGAMNLGKSAVGGAMNLGKSALSGAGQAVSSVASTGGGFFSKLAAKAGSALSGMNPVKGLASFIGKNAKTVVKSIATLPGLGALLTTAVAALDIASIKRNPDLSPDEKKDQIGKTLIGALGQALGMAGGGALGTLIPFPGIGTMIGMAGGGFVGEKLAELLGDQIGGKGIYDMVASLPIVGPMIEVGGAEDQKTEKEAGSAITAAARATGTAGECGESSGTTVEGKVTNPATANTTVGRMVAQATAEQNGLNEALNMPTATGGNTSNTANVQNKISNTTNNFNDDIRIRNNEPTIKQMQAYSIMP